MRSRATQKFWKYYQRLPIEVQRRTRKAFQLWKANPYRPSLYFKRVDDQEPLYSARVDDDHRVFGVLDGDIVIWYWIGNHDEYERLLK